MAKQIASLSDLSPDRTNANKGTQRGRGMVEASLRETGAGRSIVVDKDGRIIAGNKTLEAWADIGGEIEVIRTDGKRLVVVQRDDLDLSDDTGQARKLAYYDNRAGEVGLEWDTEQLLADISAGVDLSGMFRDDELDELLAGMQGAGEPVADVEPQIDRAEELRQRWGVESGQMWQMGEHRIVCGDCTDADVVARVMGGEKATLAPVDPPYNVGFGYDGETVDDSKADAAYEEFSRAWFAACVAVSERQIVTPGCYNLARWLRWFDAKHWAPWTKTNSMTNGVVSRFWCWEPVLFFGDKWPRSRGNDVFDYPIGQQKGVANHPCPKPLKMWLDLIENYTEEGDAVFESFSGSGTTIIACEQLGRKCRAVEISPAYVAVALERFYSATDKLPVLISGE